MCYFKCALNLFTQGKNKDFKLGFSLFFLIICGNYIRNLKLDSLETKLVNKYGLITYIIPFFVGIL